MHYALLILMAAVTQTAEQTPDLRCGSYCLYVSLKALDFPIASFAELEEKLGQPSAAGYNLGQLDEVARGYGAQTLGVQTNLENLQRRPGRFACIALIDKHHFVNFAKIDEERVFVVDPPQEYTVPLDTLRSRWDGRALLISTDPLMAEEDLPRGFPYRLVLIFTGIAAALAAGWFLLRKLRTTS
jgi:ABC-type bacteriocin/lantibiotic exporter with double-glycine peptidase domain